jgi:hypothetical protein
MAIELFHAVFLYMLGRTTSASSSMSKIWAHIIPAAVLLACDSDPVANQLFNPLVLQAVRWFTKAANSPDSASVLDALFDSLTSTNASVRDFSAKCIRENFVWVIKHSTGSVAEGVKTLLKRITNCAIHPSAAKRLGAAIVLNNLYRQLREYEAIVDVCIIDLTVVMVMSLKRANADPPSFGTAQQCVDCLRHFKRILCKMVFSSPSTF